MDRGKGPRIGKGKGDQDTYELNYGTDQESW